MSSDFSPNALRAIDLIASDDPAVQRHFAEGLLWCYGFHHERAVTCFESALALEPACPLALWGIAYAIGPFYNRPWSWFTAQQKAAVAERGYDALEQALEACGQNSGEQQIELSPCNDQSGLHKQLVLALSLRYPASHYQVYEAQDALLRAHAAAMRDLLPDCEHNLDALTLVAEAMMNCTPWQLWDLQSGTPATDAYTQEILEVIDTGLRQSSLKKIAHPGLLHLHIHALEMSPTPEAALDSANTIRQLDLPCGHLIHMATHIDILVGDYANAVATNDLAINIDHKIEAQPQEFYTISRLHNQHLKLYAAMMSGQRQAALQAQNAIATNISHDDIHQTDDYLAISVEGFYANTLHAYIRFGEWQSIVDTAPPAEPESYLLSTALHYYAVSVAQAALGDIKASETAAAHFTSAVSNIPDWHIVNNNPTLETLKIADRMQRGERLYRQAQFDDAFDELHAATRLADNLDYCEPWAWMHPPRHALGALLLEQQQIDEALDIYETDLGINAKLPRALQHPNNIWALHGLHECLVKTGKTERAEDIKQQLSAARAIADVDITASCCCRRH